MATIGTGKDYTTIASHEAAFDGNALSSGAETGQITGLTEDNSSVIFDGFDGSSNLLKYEADGVGQRPDGTDAKGTQIDVSLTLFEATNELNIQFNCVEFHTAASITTRLGNSSSVSTFTCTVHRDLTSTGITNSGTPSGANSTIHISTSLFRDIASGGIECNDADTAEYKVYNISMYNVNHGMLEFGGSFSDIKNVSIFDSSGSCFLSSPSNQSYNCSSDATASGTGSITNKDEADNFTDSSSDDFTVKDTGADIYHSGETVSGESWFPSTDLVGTTWNSSPSMGCFEYVASGGVSITPLTIATGESVGTPTISVEGVEIVPLTIASSESVGIPTISQGTEIVPLSIASSESVGVPTISLGGVSISPLSIATGENVGDPTISVGGIEIVPLTIASSEVVGNPTITIGGTIIAPLSIASSESVGNPTVSVGGIEIIPLSISSSESVGNPTITQGETITPITIVSGEVVNNPSISVGGVGLLMHPGMDGLSGRYFNSKMNGGLNG